MQAASQPASSPDSAWCLLDLHPGNLAAGDLSSRLEELNSESLSLSLETTVGEKGEAGVRIIHNVPSTWQTG